MKVGFKRDAVSKCSDMRRARLEDLHSSRHTGGGKVELQESGRRIWPQTCVEKEPLKV
jgi:hypothetical protein